MTDPIATLRKFFDDYAPEINYSAELTAALAELERRARIEARRDAWLKENTDHDLRCRMVGSEYRVGCFLYSTGRRMGTGTGPDYWTALERALDAAGAP